MFAMSDSLTACCDQSSPVWLTNIEPRRLSLKFPISAPPCFQRRTCTLIKVPRTVAVWQSLCCVNKLRAHAQKSLHVQVGARTQTAVILIFILYHCTTCISCHTSDPLNGKFLAAQDTTCMHGCIKTTKARLTNHCLLQTCKHALTCITEDSRGSQVDARSPPCRQRDKTRACVCVSSIRG